MKNFSKELAAFLAGPPQVLQSDFADRSGLNKSKLCRILTGSIQVNRATLDAIVTAVRDEDRRSRLVAAYIYDVASPVALSYLRKEKETGDPWADLDLPKLSRQGQLAVKGLLESEDLPKIEKTLIDLADLLHIPLT